jgi:hypothetical protein
MEFNTGVESDKEQDFEFKFEGELRFGEATAEDNRICRQRCQVFCVNGLRFFLFESFFAPVKQPVAGAVGMWKSRVFCEISKELWKA